MDKVTVVVYEEDHVIPVVEVFEDRQTALEFYESEIKSDIIGYTENEVEHRLHIARLRGFYKYQTAGEISIQDVELKKQ